MKGVKLFFGIVLILLPILQTSGCSSAQANTAENMGINLQYLGCSAFIVEIPDNTAIGIDFWKKGAFQYADDTPENMGIGSNSGIDRLLVSHMHADHSYQPDSIKIINGVYGGKAADTPELEKIGDISLSKYGSKHSSKTPEKYPDNAVFVIEAYGIRIIHMGDAHGTMNSREELEGLKAKIGTTDVLLLPIGSPQLHKVNSNILTNAIEILNPRVTIPMHYWKLEYKEETLDELAVKGFKVIEKDSNTLKLKLSELPEIGSRAIWSVPAGSYIRE